MQLPLQITARDFELTESIESVIREKADKLETFYDRILGCRVVIETPHRRHHKGILYNVRIYLSVPGAELVVKREPDEDLYVAIRDAFDAARRQLQDYARRQRGDVKFHEALPYAHVAQLFRDEGYGFISDVDGREIYFHKNSVVNGDFDQLEVGTQVRYVEEQGEEGPQASSVEIV